MKNRDDFIKSVWEKAETAQAEEAARRRKIRRVYSFAAAAACIALMVSIALPQDLQEAADQAYGPDIGYISTTNTSALKDGSADEEDVPADDMAGSAEDGTEQDVAMPGMTYDGALITENLDGKELYKEYREQVKAADKAKSSEAQDQLMAYYCLPVGVVIESSVQPEGGFAMQAASEEEVMKYMQWFYSIPEDQVLTTEEFKKLEVIPDKYYKFTMDKSMGEDTEGADVVFWIVGEVNLP